MPSRAFSLIQKDNEDLRRQYLIALGVIAKVHRDIYGNLLRLDLWLRLAYVGSGNYMGESHLILKDELS